MKEFLATESVWCFLKLMLQSIQRFCPGLGSSEKLTFLSLTRLGEDWKVLCVTFLDIAAKNDAGVRQGDQNDSWSWTPHSLASSLDQRNPVKFINREKNGSVVFSWAMFAELSWEL